MPSFVMNPRFAALSEQYPDVKFLSIDAEECEVHVHANYTIKNKVYTIVPIKLYWLLCSFFTSVVFFIV